MKDNRFWADRPVLVTGCTGFLGSWLTLALVRLGARVAGLAHHLNPSSHFALLELQNEAALSLGSISDAILLRKVIEDNQSETCFHLAAQALVTTANASPVGTFETNIAGTWTVLEAARQSHTMNRVIVASSDKAYGDYSGDQLPLRETHCLRAHFPYDVSKAATDMLAQTYAKIYPARSDGETLRIAITRCANIFGGGDFNLTSAGSPGRLIPDAVCSALRGERPILRSHGQHVRDFLYILDAVEAYLALARNLSREDIHGQAFNFSVETPMRVIDLTNRILTAAGRGDLEADVLGTSPAEGEILDQYLDCEKAHQILGWRARTDLDTGISETLQWYRSWLGNPADASKLSQEMISSVLN